MHLYEPRKKLCLDDINYFSNKNTSPFSYTSNKQTNLRKSITPTHRRENKSPSGFLTPKGMMKEKISKKIEQYKALDKRSFNPSNGNLRREERPLQKTPKLNKTSKKIFDDVSKKRNLSPNVLDRFSQYEKQKSIKKIKMKIISYHEETQRLPKPEEIAESKCQKQIQKIENFLNLLKKSQRNYLR